MCVKPEGLLIPKLDRGFANGRSKLQPKAQCKKTNGIITENKGCETPVRVKAHNRSGIPIKECMCLI